MNYYTPLTEDLEDAFKTCLAKAFELAALNNCSQILLVVPERGILMDIIEDTMGEKIIRDLLSKKKAKAKPFTFLLQTIQAKPDGFIKGPALAAYAYPEQLRELLKNKNIPGIVLYSNVHEEIEAFKKMADTTELKIIY